MIFKQMFDYLIAEKTPNFHIYGNWEFFSSLVSGLNRRLIDLLMCIKYQQS